MPAVKQDFGNAIAVLRDIYRIGFYDEEASLHCNPYLLIDEEDGALLLGRSILENCGYDITTATGVEEALALLESPARAIDLVVSDLVMPDRGGRELLETMRAPSPKSYGMCSTQAT